MFPVRSYSVRMKRRNRETEASFKRRMERRRQISSSSSTLGSAHTPAFRSLSAGTTPQHRSLHRTLTSASEGAEPIRRMPSLSSEPGSEVSVSVSLPRDSWHPVLQHTLYESVESGSQDSEG
ncbi:hypothetical protein AVEN_110449-1 [Araneus ventricosus]|uniref:Uncharacterized protein n=1 Tax=Araneus ventricosus TaxID=182803 RepID=A0A4Y2HYQ6_ARAVE|nr:hypothetical protein AVEN_110449-1 [Araneus ventricosus]